MNDSRREKKLFIIMMMIVLFCLSSLTLNGKAIKKALRDQEEINLVLRRTNE